VITKVFDFWLRNSDRLVLFVKAAAPGFPEAQVVLAAV
jgi:hypothetical protein